MTTQPPDDPAPGQEWQEGPTAAQTAMRAARGTGRAVRTAGRGTARVSRATVRLARRASHAEGAGQSGLARLIELHAFNAAGDAAVAISLAGTLFFAQPGEARGDMALFLGLTMLPLAIVAPLIGPFLDRFSHGRRWAIGATMALRAFLCWALASAVANDSSWLFPAALGILVSSKAYGVTKAAAAPRLVPVGVPLVKANARISLAGVIGAAVSAPLAGAAAYFGPEWSLRYGFLVFIAATILAIFLPARVDSSVGEVQLELMPGPSAAGRPASRSVARIPASVAFALRANCGPRWLSGFLTMYMAFLLIQEPLPGWEDRPMILLGLVIGAAGLGNSIGIGLASLLKRIDPRVTVILALLADAAMALVAALFFSLPALVALGLTAGLAQSLAKLSLDATIQRDVHDRVQTSAFARSDTLIQLAWVVGGFFGLAMPLIPQLGLGVAFAVLAAWAVFTLVLRGPRRRPATRGPVPPTAHQRTQQR